MISWYSIHGSSDIYWRVRVPAKAVGAKLHLLPIKGATKALSEPNLTSPFPWIATDDGASYPEHEGVGVFTRPDQVRAAHALTMRETGQAPRIVAEVDDNYTERNLTAAISDDGTQRLDIRRADEEKIRLSHLRALLVFDAVIVTTRYLADVYRKAFRSLGGKQEVIVCGNHVDVDDWPAAKPEATRLRVGFMGSVSHHRDLALAYAAFRWAADEGYEVVFCGHDPHWQHVDEARLAYRSVKRKAGYGFSYTFIPWEDDLDRSETVWPLDIAVAPLERTRFTLGRSDVKALEYTMSGAACVLANHEVYSEWEHGVTCLKASSREDYWRAVQRLAGDAELRERIVSNATQYVLEERTAAGRRHEWEEAIYG